MTPESYLLNTEEGGEYRVLFWYVAIDAGIRYGRLLIEGYSPTAGEKVTLRGGGAVPEVGSMLVVSDKPVTWLELGNERHPIYPRETVAYVRQQPSP